MSSLRGLLASDAFASHARMMRALIATVALIACGGDSSSGPTDPTGTRVAQISIAPSGPTLSVGSELALQAEVRDASGNLITGTTVFWSSADTSIVTVSSTGVLTGKAIGSAQIAASSGGQSAKTVVNVVSIPVASVAMVPSAATLVIGGSTSLRPVAYDAAGHELSERSFVWASSAERVATVDDTGLVTGVSAGSATVTATSEGKTASSTITITLIPIAAIAVTPGSAALLVGQAASLAAVATDANGNVLSGRPITWTSADSTIASVSELGLVTAVAPGTVKISAAAEGRTAAAEVVVTATTPPAPTPVASVVVTPATASIVLGGTSTLSATIRDANGATLSGRTVTWASSAPQTATVTGSGVVTAVAIGRAVVTATSEGKSDSSIVTVSAIPVASISVAPTSANLFVGDSTTITATTKDQAGNVLSGRVITWTSNAPSIAKVSATGKVTALAPGDVTITATSEGKSATSAIAVSLAPVATIALSPNSASLVVGDAATLGATLKDASGNVLGGRVIAWSSNKPGVATVDGNGVVTAVAAGSATITAKSEGKSATATITVSLVPVASVVISPTSASLYVDSTATFSATARDADNNPLSGRVATWRSDSTPVATVSATGVVKAIAPGSATITATIEDQSASATVVVSLVPVASVSVAPTTKQLIVGGTWTFSATVRDAGDNPLSGRSVTWGTSNSEKATVSATGLVTAKDTGVVKISATSEGKSDTVTVTVAPVPVATVTVDPPTASIAVYATTTLSATTTDAGGTALTGRDIVWTSSAPTVASVDASGVVTGRAEGTTTIIATSEGKTGSASITVTPAPVATVTVDQSSTNLQVGGTATLTATLKDQAGLVLSGRTITWSSSTAAVASVDASGLVTAVDTGTATITATSETRTGTASVTVTLVPVASIDLSPLSPSLLVAATTQLTAVPKDANGGTLSGRTVSWVSDNPSVATVDGSGLVTAVAAGTASITASSESQSSSTTVTVTAPVVPVATVVVTPSTATLSAATSETVTLTAIAEDTGGNPLPGRTTVWSSDTPSVATVDAASGLVTAISAGTAIIKATVDGTDGTATVTVNP